jgi:hypothetical protein
LSLIPLLSYFPSQPPELEKKAERKKEYDGTF